MPFVRIGLQIVESIMVPHTDDGRVLFAIPWHEVVVVGTTDTPVEKAGLEPAPLEEEVEFLLTHAARYLTKDPTRTDVLSCFAGLRPLVGGGDDGDTASLSRDHVIQISNSGLLTVTGGKWTTYRNMAEDTVDHGVSPRRPRKEPFRPDISRVVEGDRCSRDHQKGQRRVSRQYVD